MSPELETLSRGLDTEDLVGEYYAPNDIVHPETYQVIIPQNTKFAVFGDVVRYKIGQQLKQLKRESKKWQWFKKQLRQSDSLPYQMKVIEEDDEDFERLSSTVIRPTRRKLIWVISSSATATLVAVALVLTASNGDHRMRAAAALPATSATEAPSVTEEAEVEKVTARWFRYYEERYGGNIYIYIEPTGNGGTHYKMYGSKNCKDFIWDEIAECNFNDPETFPETKDEQGNEKARYFAKRALAHIMSESLESVELALKSTLVQRKLEEISAPGSDIVWNNSEDEAITHQTQQETNKALPRKVTAWVTVPGETTRLRVSAYRETGGVNGTTTLFVQGTIYNVSSRPIQISRREHQKFYKVLSELELRDAAKLALQEVYQQNDQPAPAEYKINVEMEEGW